jgi:hypothetical protein
MGAQIKNYNLSDSLLPVQGSWRVHILKNNLLVETPTDRKDIRKLGAIVRRILSKICVYFGHYNLERIKLRCRISNGGLVRR